MSTDAAPRKRRETKNSDEENRFGFRFLPSLSKRLRKAAEETGEDMTKITETALDLYLRNAMPEPIETPQASAPQNVHIKYLSGVPCGPLAEAISEASDLTVSADLARIMDLRSSDFVMQANGQSMQGEAMEGQDITDGDMLFFRFTPPPAMIRPGQIVCAQILSADGDASCTVKFWGKPIDGTPRLIDGKGDEYLIPEDTREIVPLGILKASIRTYN